MARFLRNVLLLSLLAPVLGHATLLGFEPSDSTVGLGDTIAIDVVATPESGELIGAYDFLVNFDPALLALNDVIFGASLNDDPFLCNLFGCRDFFDSGGAVAMFEAAAPFAPLSILQNGLAPVVLATLLFDAVGPGTGILTFSGNIVGQTAPFNLLGDELGVPLPVFEPGVATITVTAVPEPPVILLVLTGLFLLAGNKIRIISRGPWRSSDGSYC